MDDLKRKMKRKSNKAARDKQSENWNEITNIGRNFSLISEEGNNQRKGKLDRYLDSITELSSKMSSKMSDPARPPKHWNVMENIDRHCGIISEEGKNQRKGKMDRDFDLITELSSDDEEMIRNENNVKHVRLLGQRIHWKQEKEFGWKKNKDGKVFGWHTDKPKGGTVRTHFKDTWKKDLKKSAGKGIRKGLNKVWKDNGLQVGEKAETYKDKKSAETQYATVHGIRVLSADADATFLGANAKAYANPTSAEASASAAVAEANASAGQSCKIAYPSVSRKIQKIGKWKFLKIEKNGKFGNFMKI